MPKTVTLRMDDHLYELFRGLAERDNRPLSNFIETAALRYIEGEQLVEEARDRGLVLMCDHTFCYTPVVRRLRELLHSGELGDLHYIDSTRVNLGLVQNDIDVFWDLAPHDLSVLDFILPAGCHPVEVAAHGAVLERELCQAADLVLACSHEDRVLFHDLYDVPFAKCAVVPNGTFTGPVVVADAARRAAAKQELALPAGPMAVFVATEVAPVAGTELSSVGKICSTLAWRVRNRSTTFDAKFPAASSAPTVRA